MIAWLYVLGTVLFTVYGQIVLKWRIGKYGAMPESSLNKLLFLFRLFLDPFILSGFISAFIASLLWMAAMTKIKLSVAYPFTGLSFVLILILSALLFKEPLNYYKVIGIIFVIAGIFISSRGI